MPLLPGGVRGGAGMFPLEARGTAIVLVVPDKFRLRLFKSALGIVVHVARAIRRCLVVVVVFRFEVGLALVAFAPIAVLNRWIYHFGRALANEAAGQRTDGRPDRRTDRTCGQPDGGGGGADARGPQTRSNWMRTGSAGDGIWIQLV